MTTLTERAAQIHGCAVSMRTSAERLRTLPTVEGVVIMTPEFVATLAASMESVAQIFDELALCLED